MFWISKPSVFHFYYFHLLSFFFTIKNHFALSSRRPNFSKVAWGNKWTSKTSFRSHKTVHTTFPKRVLEFIVCGHWSNYRLLFRFSVTCDIYDSSLVTIQVKKLSLCSPNRVRKTTHSPVVSFCVHHVSVFRIQCTTIHKYFSFSATILWSRKRDRSGKFSKSDRIGMVCSQSLIDWVARFHESESSAPSGFGPINASFFRYYPTGKPSPCSYNLLLNQNNFTPHMSQYFLLFILVLVILYSVFFYNSILIEQDGDIATASN